MKNIFFYFIALWHMRFPSTDDGSIIIHYCIKLLYIYILCNNNDKYTFKCSCAIIKKIAK